VQADGSAFGDAGRQAENASFSTAAVQLADVKGGDGDGPVDLGQLVAVDSAGQMPDKAAGEVATVQSGAVTDDQLDACGLGG
jgi:hypothetical protein